MGDAAGPVVVVPAPPRVVQGPTDLAKPPRGPSMISETLNDMLIEPIAALVRVDTPMTARGAPHHAIASPEVVEDEYDKFGKGKDLWDPAHMMSELLFTATATDEQKAKRQVEMEFRDRMKVVGIPVWLPTPSLHPPLSSSHSHTPFSKLREQAPGAREYPRVLCSSWALAGLLCYVLR